jgi:hypothetical protein
MINCLLSCLGQDSDGIHINVRPGHVDEAQGVGATAQSWAGPTLLPDQAGVVLAEGRQLDPIDVHIHIAAVDVFREGQGQLLAGDGHFRKIPKRARVMDAIIVGTRPAVNCPRSDVRPGRVGVVICPGCQGCRQRQDADPVDVDVRPAGMHEAQGVHPRTEHRAGPALLPGERCVVLAEGRQLDPIHVHIHISAVDVFGEDQAELAGIEVDFRIIPERARVVQTVVGGTCCAGGVCIVQGGRERRS